MTKEDIKKALKCCDSHIPSACGDCPYCWVEECKDKLIADVLTLITEQEKENEKLEQQNAIQCDAWQKLSDENESLAAENSSNFRYNSVLRKENKKLKAEIEQLKAEYEQAKIDVLNKAKEKLDSAPNGWAYTGYIDDLIEEVENNGR